MLSNTYCSVLWNHQFIDGSGRIKPCCRFKETENNNINSTTIEDVFYSDTMKQRRGHSLRGDPIEGCRRCYEEELNGKKSLRQRYNDNEYLKPKDLNNPKVEWLELAISNECNLACRMCDSRYSTKWFDEEFEFVGKATPLTKINIAQVYPFVPTLKHLKITGGEPFVTPDHWRLLDYIIEHDYAKNIYLNYSTNCTVYPKESIVERLRQFKWVEVALSLDSIVAEETEYLRFPSKQTDVISTIEKFIALQSDINLKLIARPTVSLLNVYHLPETLEWLANNGIRFNATHLTFPSYLSETVLPKEDKDAVETKFNSFEFTSAEAKAQCEYILRYMRSKDDPQDEFLKHTYFLDKSRKQSFADVYSYFCILSKQISEMLTS
jgi:MoaA/NifB/PqqE/SkfB family radical SAM enzyme